MNDPFRGNTQNEGAWNSQQYIKKEALLSQLKTLKDEQERLHGIIYSPDVEAEDQELGAAFDAVTKEIAALEKQLQDEYGAEGGRRKKRRTKRRISRRSKSRRSKSCAKKSRRSKH